MRILAITDEIAPQLYQPGTYEALDPIDLLLSCGDLSYSYMEYVVTYAQNCGHAYFVHGNHDQTEYLHSGRKIVSPGGWVNLDRRVVYIRDQDLLIAGLEGSIRYRPDARYQYSQREMRLRAHYLVPRLLFNRVRHGRYLDILIAHSPAAGIHDGSDHAHKGFEVLTSFIQRFQPRLFVHGHVHHYECGPWHSRYEKTEVVNVYPYQVIDLASDGVRYQRTHHFC